MNLSNNEHMMKNEKEKVNYQHGIIVDCANGVASIVLKEILEFAGFQERLPCTLINDSEKPDYLNDGCGAEHVHKEQALPSNWNHPGQKCISFDGDGDR
jgi:phosphomannomutase